jgi:hypothetical protein
MIYINLLAEAQEKARARRTDPIRISCLVGGAIFGLILLWSGVLYCQVCYSEKEVQTLKDKVIQHQQEFTDVNSTDKATEKEALRLAQLDRLTTNRVFCRSILNGLPHCSVPEIQLTHFEVRMQHKVDNGSKKASEQIHLVIQGKNVDSDPGGGIQSYEERLSTNQYLVQGRSKGDIKLASMSAPEAGADGGSFVVFSLDYNYPEVVR